MWGTVHTEKLHCEYCGAPAHERLGSRAQMMNLYIITNLIT